MLKFDVKSDSMKKSPSKTYRIGKLTISSSYNEYIFLYNGGNKVHFNRFKKIHFPPINRKVLLSIPPLLLLIGLILFLPNNKSEKKENFISDEDKKNQLIQSTRTDYTDPDQIAELLIRIHKVERGETLSQIAKKYGVSMDTICGNNKLVSYDIIREGQIIKVPNKDGILYTMKKGQNIHSVARKYKVPIEKIVAENNLSNYDFVPVGHDIFIPDAKPLNMIPGFLWPVHTRRITCGYGWRRNPFNRRRMEFHKGLDIRARYQWARATKYGKVTYTGWLGGYGKAVLIAHPNGWKSLYAHLSRIVVRRGQYVKQGQIIAKSGNTGRSSGPHLHFELIKNGRHVNPYKYIK